MVSANYVFNCSVAAARTPKKRSGKAAVKQSPAPKVEEG